MLANKSLIELRGIAQSFGIGDLFQKDHMQLIQAIELKQKDIAPSPVIDIPKPEYDARLMTKPPSKLSSQNDIEQLLSPYVSMGMHLSFDHERWYIKHGKKTDEGTLRMPLKTVLYCANRLMQ